MRNKPAPVEVRLLDTPGPAEVLKGAITDSRSRAGDITDLKYRVGEMVQSQEFAPSSEMAIAKVYVESPKVKGTKKTREMKKMQKQGRNAGQNLLVTSKGESTISIGAYTIGEQPHKMGSSEVRTTTSVA